MLLESNALARDSSVRNGTENTVLIFAKNRMNAEGTLNGHLLLPRLISS
ncbi:MAG: hypothetical protein ACYCT2_08020 [Thermoplasmataceae archaeon]